MCVYLLLLVHLVLLERLFYVLERNHLTVLCGCGMVRFFWGERRGRLETIRIDGCGCRTEGDCAEARLEDWWLERVLVMTWLKVTAHWVLHPWLLLLRGILRGDPTHLVCSTLLEHGKCSIHEFLQELLSISSLRQIILKLSIVELGVLIFLFKGFESNFYLVKPPLKFKKLKKVKILKAYQSV